MILDKIENAGLYNLAPGLQKGIDYLLATDLKALNQGTINLNGGIKVIVNKYETKPEADCKPEAHKKYIDIQYLVEGEELIGYAPLNNQEVTIDNLDENDVVFFNAETSLCKLTAGLFAIYYPTDIHQPGIQADKATLVTKIVIKIPV